jgi:hypothetical protein
MTELTVKYRFVSLFSIVTFAAFPFRIYAMDPALVTAINTCRTVTQYMVERGSYINVLKLRTTLTRL